MESRKIKKKLDEFHLKLKSKQENITGSHFFKTTYNENNNENIEKTSFYKTRSVGMRTQNSFFNINRGSSTSLIDGSQIMNLVDKIKNEVFILLIEKIIM